MKFDEVDRRANGAAVVGDSGIPHGMSKNTNKSEISVSAELPNVRGAKETVAGVKTARSQVQEKALEGECATSSAGQESNVFVQIPAYRDAQLIATVKDLVETSAHPTMLRIVIVWQHADEESITEFKNAGIEPLRTVVENGRTVHYASLSSAAIEIIDVASTDSKGCGWARNLAQQRYRGERYNLQIDAHHRFAASWDARMVAMLESLRETSESPILTGYPPSFDPGNDPVGRQLTTGAIIVQRFSSSGIMIFKSVPLPDYETRRRPFRARFMAGGFVFSDGKFAREVMNDPEQFFSTEEIVMSARAYTHGYDFYHPHEPMIWHQYLNPSPKIWDDHSSEAEASGIVERAASRRISAALQKAYRTLCITDDLVPAMPLRYGLGAKRTLTDYERFAGFCLTRRAVRKEALLPSEPDGSSKTLDDTDWAKGLVCPRTMIVRLSLRSSATLNESAVIVVSRSDDGSEVSVRSLTNDQISLLSKDGHLVYSETITHHVGSPPTSYSVYLAEEAEKESDSLTIAVEEDFS